MKILNNYEHYKDANLKKYNTYRINAIASYLVFVKNIDELITLLKYLKENKIKYLVLGNGSNVIFNFEYYDGVIIKLDKMNDLKINSNLVTVEAGYSLIKLSRDILSYGLTGLEFAAGIPGLVGASVAMNAGAYNKEMADVVKEIKVLDENYQIVTLTKEELLFTYRNSLLKQNKNYICLSATLELEYGDKQESLNLIKDRMKRRMETQPLEYPSAGSTFRNPLGMHAGKLIEDCNLKGYNINGAEVSTKHANFIINKSDCRGRDVVELINLIKKEVLNKYNIELILEQEIIN